MKILFECRVLKVVYEMLFDRITNSVRLSSTALLLSVVKCGSEESLLSIDAPGSLVSETPSISLPSI